MSLLFGVLVYFSLLAWVLGAKLSHRLAGPQLQKLFSMMMISVAISMFAQVGESVLR